MEFLQASNRQLIAIASRKPLGAGGEARIYGVKDAPKLAAKIYHRPTAEQAAKLKAMVLRPPEDPMVKQGHVSIAWPTDLLVDPKTEEVRGFLMPYIQGLSPAIDFYHPKTRRQKHPLFSFLYLLRAARNLAACVGAVHARGHVVGDLNESNILLSETALVALVDTDSFQVPKTVCGEWHRCGVGKLEFTPPELQGKSFAWIDRDCHHDCFGLAVLVFLFLMEGIHPFAGAHLGHGEPPTLEQRIARGAFPYAPGRIGDIVPMPTSPRLDTLNRRIQELFLRAFVRGHSEPVARPSAHEWQLALLDAEKSLITCDNNEQHQYGEHLSSCPWCERFRRFGGVDAFPSKEMVTHRQHLKGRAASRRGHSFSRLTYEEAMEVAAVAASRRKQIQKLLFIGSVVIGGVLVSYWIFAARYWMTAP